MKTRIFIIAILSIAAIELSAQTYGQSYTPAARNYSAIQLQAIQSQQIMSTGVKYNGTVYEPFSTTVPSEQSAVGSENSSEGPHPERHIRKGLIGGPEDPLGPSPIGDAIIPLLLMALVYGIGCTVYRRRKRQA